MSTLVQLLLVVVVSTLTFLVTFAAIQVFQILHEFRQSLKRFNQILDNTHTLSNSAAKPITAVNEFFSEVKTLVDQTEDDIISATPDRVISHPTSSPKSSVQRFFRRAGLPLRS